MRKSTVSDSIAEVSGRESHKRMTIAIFEASRLTISSAEADFKLVPDDGGTQLTLDYSYTLNLLGRLLQGCTDKQLRKGIGALARSLQGESEGAAARQSYISPRVESQ